MSTYLPLRDLRPNCLPSSSRCGIMEDIADVLFYSLVCIVHEHTDEIHCRQNLAGPGLSILLDSSKPLVLASWEHFVLLWFSLWSVWIGAPYLWGLCRLTISKAFTTTGRCGSHVPVTTRPVFTKKWKVVRYGIVCAWKIHIVWLLLGYFFICIYKGNSIKIILALSQV